jgi:hypothetical protein
MYQLLNLLSKVLATKVQVPNMVEDETLLVATKDDFEDEDYDDLDEDFCPPPSEGVSDSEEDVEVQAFSK